MASIACTVTMAVHAVFFNDLGNVTNLRQFLIVSCHTGIYSELACRVTMLYLPWLPWQCDTIKTVFNCVESHRYL
jgi:hypothetical protein